MAEKKKSILGQDVDVLIALWANIVSWFVRKFAPSLLPHLIKPVEQQDTEVASLQDSKNRTKCVSIGRPGGIEQLQVITLKPGIVTCGYNLVHCNNPPPFSRPMDDSSSIPSDCVVLKNQAFSVNYADCCIRWGLYESAKQFVGWPIVPGFDIAGVVDQVGSNEASKDSSGASREPWKVGDQVFGCSLFGAYSSRVLVPSVQLRKIPKGLTVAQAASIPAASLTALYALFLAGHYHSQQEFGSKFNNRAILIHSAAGGVGGMLVQMAKILGLSPIVGVVGRSSKVDAAKLLGCDVVIDKSQDDLWEVVKQASPNGYSAIMDANGVSTLAQSYDHLAPAGRLIVYGFHSNLPIGQDMLSPMEWIRMAKKMVSMPKFDPMDLTTSSKSVLGFNLSFFAEEVDMLSELFDQICVWLEDGKLQCPRISEMDMEEIAQAHELIQSGNSVGKIVLRTN